MNNRTAGWLIFAAGLAMMLGLLTVDVSRLTTWGEMTQPPFIASVMGHLSAVLTAFVGGRLIPESRQDKHTRQSDENREE